MARAEVALFYVDASALVKLLRDEAQSDALRAFVCDADLVSCELVLTEVPRAVRRAAAVDSGLPGEKLLDRAAELLEAIALRPVDRELLIAAGSLAEPALRALDAVHVAAAVGTPELDGFVTYDERQAGAARLAGLRTIAPGD